MKYQPHEDNFLLENYLVIPTKRMSKMLNRSESSARQRMKLLGIVVPPEIIDKFKQDSRYKAGSSPVNKGKKLIDYCSLDKIERMKATQFKKGLVPHNHKPTGTQRLTKDGYLEIKVAEPNKWRGKHIVEWESINGKLQKGHIVVFKSQNKFCTCISNLEMITRVENMRRNTVHNYPKDVALAVQLRGALNRQINKYKKKLYEK